MGRRMYVGLDTAKCTGVALITPYDMTCIVWEVTGTPLFQWQAIEDLTMNSAIHFGMEELHVFVNAATIRNLSERYGFLKWSLIAHGCQPREVGPRVTRSIWGITTKEDAVLRLNPLASPMMLTTNHADAILVAAALIHQDDPDFDVDRLTVHVNKAVIQKFPKKPKAQRIKVEPPKPVAKKRKLKK